MNHSSTSTAFPTAPRPTAPSADRARGRSPSPPSARSLSRWLERLGRWAASHPWRVLGAWLAVAIVVIGASSTVGRELEDSFGAPGLDSQQAVELLSAAGFEASGVTAQVVATPTDETATFFDSPVATAELAALESTLARLPKVVSTSEPATALAQGRDVAVATGTVSPDGRVALIRIQYPMLEELTADDLKQLDDIVADARALGDARAGAATDSVTDTATQPEAGDGVDPNGGALRVEAGGELYDLFDTETPLSELIGVGAAVVILLVAFGSIVAMGLPIGIALFGLGLGVSSFTLVNHLVEIPSWTPILAAMVGLGVGIDYALFLVVRHREHLAAGLSVPDAAGRAVATAGQAVIFAGGTVVVAILGLAVAGIPFVTAAGIGTSIVVGIMVVAAVTLLPAFLGLAGARVNSRKHRRSAARSMGSADADAGGTVGRVGPRSSGAAVSPRWERWGAHVARHAVLYTVGVTALLVAAAAPVLALRLGYPDQGTNPESRTERRAYDLVADGFGPGINGPLMVAVDTAGDATLIDTVAVAVAADPGIAAVAPPELDEASGVAMLVAFPASAPQDELTTETVHRLRNEVFPPILDDGPGRAHVGGPTAAWADLGDRVSDRMPYFFAAVLAVSMALLMLVFRSVLVPIKAALLNLLSIGASYGVLVMVFQWGWGKELIGLEATVPIVSFIPMFMFAILFGLSMDYEVFLLSRVREEYQATGDNDAAVVRGLASTARVITSAALIMISVFAGFVITDDPLGKMFGLGLAVAILVDASIVRMVLVPATMKLMGDANWWLPGWLDRILPAIDLEGDAPVTPTTGASLADAGVGRSVDTGAQDDRYAGVGR